jgi:hypothetical protein
MRRSGLILKGQHVQESRTPTAGEFKAHERLRTAVHQETYSRLVRIVGPAKEALFGAPKATDMRLFGLTSITVPVVQEVFCHPKGTQNTPLFPSPFATGSNGLETHLIQRFNLNSSLRLRSTFRKDVFREEYVREHHTGQSCDFFE